MANNSIIMFMNELIREILEQKILKQVLRIINIQTDKQIVLILEVFIIRQFF
ncbi:unnamed protein product [Paramecium sonneborni]|uniref:Uncharacterized protein n=1 Tax=Paramecium sonneborni TaxID=65129 RepID=A0A8S1QLW9_9CILI|nr:unnamed protein product [Paramecium sonneborni]